MNFLTIFYFLFFTSLTLIFGGDFHLDKKQDELRTLLEDQNSTKSKEEFETFETAGTYFGIVDDEKRNESLILFKQTELQKLDLRRTNNSHHVDKHGEICKVCYNLKEYLKLRKTHKHHETNQSTAKHHVLQSTESSFHKEENETLHRDDCPLDIKGIGRATWNLLHTISAYFPNEPSIEDQENVKTMIMSLAKVYPCAYCAKDLQEYISKNPIDVQSREKLSSWMCHLHNDVNEKLKKPYFDCSQVNERWYSGWKDGSCGH